MNTEDLIENMAQGLEPVAPLPSPGRRAALWSFGAALYVGVLVLAMVAVNGSANGGGVAFWAAQAAAIATGVLASAAAFTSVVPGSTHRLRWWAVAAAIVWLGSLVAAPPAADWSAVAAASHEWLCVGFMVVGGAPLALVLARLLRRGAPLSPTMTAALAALAVGSLANVGACLSLPHTDGAVTFAWHGGVVLGVVALAALSGQHLFSWARARSALARAGVQEGE